MSTLLTDTSASLGLPLRTMPQNPDSKAQCCPFNGDYLHHEAHLDAGVGQGAAGWQDERGQLHISIALLAYRVPRGEQEGGCNIEYAQSGQCKASHAGRLGMRLSFSNPGRKSSRALQIRYARLRSTQLQSQSRRSRSSFGTRIAICVVGPSGSCISEVGSNIFHGALLFSCIPMNTRCIHLRNAPVNAPVYAPGPLPTLNNLVGRTAFVLPAMVESSLNMKKSFASEDTSVLTLPKLYSYEALVCGFHLRGTIVLPDMEEKFHYGVGQIIRRFLHGFPHLSIGLTPEECWADNQVVWKEEME